MCLQMNGDAHVAGNYITCLVETEGRLKVRGGHVHCKSGNVSETLQDRDAATRDYEWKMTYDLSSSGYSDGLERLSETFTYCKPFLVRVFELCSSCEHLN